MSGLNSNLLPLDQDEKAKHLFAVRLGHSSQKPVEMQMRRHVEVALDI